MTIRELLQQHLTHEEMNEVEELARIDRGHDYLDGIAEYDAAEHLSRTFLFCNSIMGHYFWRNIVLRINPHYYD